MLYLEEIDTKLCLCVEEYPFSFPCAAPEQSPPLTLGTPDSKEKFQGSGTRTQHKPESMRGSVHLSSRDVAAYFWRGFQCVQYQGTHILHEKVCEENLPLRLIGLGAQQF